MPPIRNRTLGAERQKLGPRRRGTRGARGLWVLCMLAAAIVIPAVGYASSDHRTPSPRLETRLASEDSLPPGAFCPLGGCRPPSSSPVTDIAGFAGAVLVLGWLARRRDTDAR